MFKFIWKYLRRKIRFIYRSLLYWFVNFAGTEIEIAIFSLFSSNDNNDNLYRYIHTEIHRYIQILTHRIYSDIYIYTEIYRYIPTDIDTKKYKT